MFYTLAVLLIFQCLGEGLAFILQSTLRWSIPGPVLGMLLLFFALLASPRLMERIEESSHHVLKHMSLFFIPAGAGIMVSASGIAQHWLALMVAIVVSTVLTLIVTAWSMRWLMPAQGHAAESASKPFAETESPAIQAQAQIASQILPQKPPESEQ